MATITELTAEAEHKMHKSIDATQHEFSTLRTGRANPGMLDGILVDAYGSQMPINQIAQVHVPEARQLTITPYDRALVGAIERAIKISDLNINPINDGAGIRLNLPILTEERRKDLVKQLHKKAEDGRVAIRNVRRDANDHFKQLEKKGEVSEDDCKRALEKLQKLTDKCIADLDHLQKAKEAELMEV
jgi:ribosome recycling factor